MHTDSQNKKINGTILLCDDDFYVVDITERILKKCNYFTYTSLNSIECLDLFQDKKDEIDLVMLDIDLPDINGIELSRRIKKIKPETLILFFSGHTLDVCRGRFNLTEDIEILEKPFGERSLRRKLEEMLK